MKPQNLKPVTGSVRWLRVLVIGQQLGRLAITNANGQTTEYDVQAFLDGERILGFGLAKDDDEIYAIDVSPPWGWTCDCADSQYRNRECKHLKAIRVALTHAGIVVPKPAQPSTEVERDNLQGHQ